MVGRGNGSRGRARRILGRSARILLRLARVAAMILVALLLALALPPVRSGLLHLGLKL